MITQHIHAEGHEQVKVTECTSFYSVDFRQRYAFDTSPDGERVTLAGTALSFIVKRENAHIYRRLAGALEDAAALVESLDPAADERSSGGA